MRRLFFSVIVLLSFTQMKGQNYFDFPDTNVVWCGYRNFIMYNAPDTDEVNVYTYQQIIGNDTIINNIDYKNIFESGEFYWEAYPIPYYFGSINYIQQRVGSIREFNKVIYIVPPNSSIEYVLYDFNLIEGDTISVSVNSGGDIVISSIDSILISTAYRKKFNISSADTNLWSDPNYFEYVSIIEGIGSIHGLLWTLSPYNPEIGGELLAFKQNGMVIYPDSFTACEVTGVEEIYIDGENVMVYPNPVVSDVFEINYILEQNKSGQLEIMNSNGQVILIKTLPQWSSHQKLNIPELSDGIYLMRLKSGDKTSMFKFVKL